jgi:hypothetical protein
VSDLPARSPHPDPWAVVEHHARVAAERGTEAVLSPGQRLALYATTAPEVIGARRMERSEFGVLGRFARSGEWWTAAIPGSRDRLAWNEQGDVVVSNRMDALILQAVIGGFATLLAFTVLGRIGGPRALIPALMVGAGVAMVAARLATRWTMLGDGNNHPLAERTLQQFLQRYEEGVARE